MMAVTKHFIVIYYLGVIEAREYTHGLLTKREVQHGWILAKFFKNEANIQPS